VVLPTSIVEESRHLDKDIEALGKRLLKCF